MRRLLSNRRSEESWKGRDAAAALLILYLAGVGTACARGVTESVKAKEFILVNDQGQQRASLRLLADGSPALGIMDSRGVLRLTLQCDKEGSPTVHFLDAHGKARLFLGLVGTRDEAVPTVTLSNKHGQEQIVAMLRSENAPGLALFRGDERLGINVSIDDDGRPSVAVTDVNGATRDLLGKEVEQK